MTFKSKMVLNGYMIQFVIYVCLVGENKNHMLSVQYLIGWWREKSALLQRL